MEFEYAFEMNPMPEITLEAESIELCEGDHAILNFSLTGINDNGTVVINGVSYDVDASTTFIDLGSLEAGTTVFNITEVNGNCSTYYNEGDLVFTANVNLVPQLEMSEMPESICEGEEVTLNFFFTGVGPFAVEATGIESFTSEEDSYTMTFTPAEDVNITVVSITSGNGCVNAVDQNISIVVNPMAAVPEINGDAELDVRLTPTSTYTIANDVMVSYTLEPEEAGAIVETNDGMTIDITWSETYKGEATLTATPIGECNNGDSNMTIVVKNTTDVNEIANSARIYPNPTSEKVNIECLGMTHVTVFNTLGQMVYSAEVDTDKVVINTETMPAGSYVVRITTAEGSIAKHLNVIK